MPSPAFPAVRKRLPSEDRRQQILEVSARLFVERGFEAVGMGDIAQVLGVSRPTVYSYFTSPEGVLEALLDERLRDLLARLEPLLSAQAGQPGLIEGVFHFLLGERDTLALLHSGTGAGFQVRRRGFLDDLAARLRGHPGLLAGQDPDLLLLITTLLDALAHRTVTDPALDAGRLARTLGTFVRGGVQAVLEGTAPGT
ncbi:TetR family transcriptional regulator [Deinococcus sp. RL]|uniref:TetR/AcrR family transcriptional regulator n=1 Tax=Deinococcus sp. RL TaxID=1489678 RepID=UPI0004D9CC67|nr:TetR/AcrR family transcriptional regulator [Deinococcus sp. RL]KEF34592.1 TetR family transcriptional regulator [Deinococcus sp. RL]